MADKRKVVSEEKSQETDRQFLERVNVKFLMQDVMGKIIANRPDDPMVFLADYFEAYDEQSGLIQKALQTIQMTHHSRPVFESNVSRAYNILNKHKVYKRVKGVNGVIYNELLQALCREIESSIVSKLMNKIECCDYEAVPYDVFRSGVFTCCVLQDYCKLTENLFQSLDLDKTGKADKILCDTVLQQLNTVLKNTKPDSNRIFQASHKLGPDILYHSLERAMTNNKGQTMITLEQFISDVCDSFLLKVKPLR
ncbi:hypothetical protein LOTGIDRAFT_204984 [Lottia gigantea]|uniref:Tubulin polyglutamylase complex subunit 1-like C-terminal domain-containing protein n=1 Tax=Lottia gigantea TaxID=225164 RepID=V4B1P2_LOTGI|nr:hypothetical protein LOTGIDRAFT_204984 [Lottia gigantea]ESP04273.1 hypothetical protein LOTGIDRAFT_204984 [Lottia gigantea]